MGVVFPWYDDFVVDQQYNYFNRTQKRAFCLLCNLFAGDRSEWQLHRCQPPKNNFRDKKNCLLGGRGELPLHGEFSSCFLRMLSKNFDFAGEPHPQNCKTVDRSYRQSCRVHETHDLSSQAIVPVLLSLFGLYYPSPGAATLKIRDISGK